MGIIASSYKHQRFDLLSIDTAFSWKLESDFKNGMRLFVFIYSGFLRIVIVNTEIILNKVSATSSRRCHRTMRVRFTCL
ncbi:hypothetical protein K1T71_008115 [Dendrolimus kikuchii]|uniref:Uncharacterized protein n=1 Tax=Dendrolimus kikuchii TaxID=765133 RepID=A0ACC1CWI1_9NEOP|nr:hypothetical protein K1T71_008115 [Dendrolimus kikuchii]